MTSQAYSSTVESLTPDKYCFLSQDEIGNFKKHLTLQILHIFYLKNFLHAFGPKKIYFVPKILMKQPHHCSY